MRAVRDFRRQSVGAVAAAGILAAAILGSGTTASAAAKAPRLGLEIGASSQRVLTTTHAVKVTVDASGGGARVKLATTVKQGGKTSAAADPRTLTVGPGKPGSASIPLNQTGRSLVQSCLATQLEVVAKVRRGGAWRKAAEAKEAMARDTALCDGNKPVGVDLADASKCDPIAPTDSGECLFPYPNDYYTVARLGHRHR